MRLVDDILHRRPKKKSNLLHLSFEWINEKKNEEAKKTYFLDSRETEFVQLVFTFWLVYPSNYPGPMRKRGRARTHAQYNLPINMLNAFCAKFQCVKYHNMQSGVKRKKRKLLRTSSTNANSSVGMLPCPINSKKNPFWWATPLSLFNMYFFSIIFFIMKNHHSFCAPIIDLQNWKTCTSQMAILQSHWKITNWQIA